MVSSLSCTVRIKEIDVDGKCQANLVPSIDKKLSWRGTFECLHETRLKDICYVRVRGLVERIHSVIAGLITKPLDFGIRQRPREIIHKRCGQERFDGPKPPMALFQQFCRTRSGSRWSHNMVGASSRIISGGSVAIKRGLVSAVAPGTYSVDGCLIVSVESTQSGVQACRQLVKNVTLVAIILGCVGGKASSHGHSNYNCHNADDEVTRISTKSHYCVANDAKQHHHLCNCVHPGEWVLVDMR